ncbi:MAG: hypothetical protein QJR03_11115 [Sphaerobacter sp.]|nr:hypothetical protein [Sphaerobacter sp.]
MIIAATNRWVIALDNIHWVRGWLSNALCRLSAGGGLATRERRPDGDEVIFDAMRSAILHSIGGMANQADLLQRRVILRLPRIGKDDRPRRRGTGELRSQAEPRSPRAARPGRRRAR